MGASAREYSVTAHLQIVVPIGHDYDCDLLDRQIRLVDQAYPWSAQYGSGRPAEGINEMSKASMKEAEGIDRIYSVVFHPPFILTREQVDTYERYCNTLARELAKIMPKSVLYVDSRIVMSGMFGGGYRPRDF